MDEVREKARKPISGPVLSAKLSTAGASEYGMENPTSGRVEALSAERGSLGEIGVRGGRGEAGDR